MKNQQITSSNRWNFHILMTAIGSIVALLMLSFALSPLVMQATPQYQQQKTICNQPVPDSMFPTTCATTTNQQGREISLNADVMSAGVDIDIIADNEDSAPYITTIGESETSTTLLEIPGGVQSVDNSTVSVPIDVTDAGNIVSVAVMNLHFDTACLSFDTTDANADGVPDSIAEAQSNDFDISVAIDNIGAGQIRLLVAPTSFINVPAFEVGVLFTINFGIQCNAPNTDVIFTDYSFGNAEGEAVLGQVTGNRIGLNPEPTPTLTSTPTSTNTSTPTPTSTSTNTPTAIPTDTPTLTHTPTLTSTNTPTATPAPTNTPTVTPTPTNTPTVTPTPTNTNTPIDTSTVTPAPTNTQKNTPTITLTPMNTITNTPTATPTDLPTSTYTPTLTSTSTPTATPTPTNILTNTPTATPTPSNTLTNTPAVPTPVESPTMTATQTITLTMTPSSTPTPTPSLTTTYTPTLTQTPTEVPMLPQTHTPLPTVTNTNIPLNTEPPTPTLVYTATKPATNTPTVTITPAPISPSHTPTNTIMPTTTSPPAQSPVTNTPTSTPIDTAPFEPNEVCETATPISIDGSSQQHTFHTSTDVDWVSFHVPKEGTYQIVVEIEGESSPGVDMTYYTDCSGDILGGNSGALSPGIRLTIQAEEDQSFYVKLMPLPSRSIKSTVRYTIRIEPITGAVIVVAGRLRELDHVQKNIDTVANAFVTLARNKGVRDDDIYVLATNTYTETIGAGIVDAPATKEKLRYAIIDWAEERARATGSLIIYMVDHGEREKLYLDKVQEQILTPLDLDQWLTTLEETVPDLRTTIIIEACHSGSFITGDSSISAENRLVITSASEDYDAYTSRDGVYFTDSLVVKLGQNNSFGQAFESAKTIVDTLYESQQPWIDANGNRIANEEEDIKIAYDYDFQSTDVVQGPQITNVFSPTLIVDGQGTFTVEIQSTQILKEVWVVVHPPNSIPPSEGDGVLNTNEDLEEISLTKVSETEGGSSRYIGHYAKFYEKGATYRLAFHSIDINGLHAEPVILPILVPHYSFLPVIS